MLLDRRFVVAGALAAVTFFGCGGGEMAEAPAEPTGSHIAYVGTYTEGDSEGIYAYRYDDASGAMTSLGLAVATPSPSFLTLHPNGEYLYAVNEPDPDSPSKGSISSFSINKESGQLTFINKVDSLGESPCHLVLDHTGNFIFVANWAGGNVGAWRVLPDGSIGENTALIQHESPSGDAEQEIHPHATLISSDNERLFVADAGIDRIMVYRINHETGELTANDPPAGVLDPDAAPRHIAFHPDGMHAYANGEGSSTVITMDFDPETATFTPKQTVSSLPEGYDGRNSTAEIEVSDDGNFVYVSNRGNDTIGVYSVDPETKTLTPVEHTPIQGQTPRNFAIDPSGKYLFAEGQRSNTIVQFARDASTGKLTPTGQVLTDAPNPVCMIFMPTS